MMSMKSITVSLLGVGAATLALLSAPSHAAEKSAVLDTYADIAAAVYEDSLVTARNLQRAVNALIADPTEANLLAARAAWLDARVPYQQSEVYRFGNAIVDDWEGKVNAWPLDEGLIDYVDPRYGTASDENPLYTVNVVANASLKIGGETVDASNITKSLLQDTLHEAGEVEANVATGYHAVEFLLWGQDTNGTGPGAGNRPASDYDAANCTHGNCDRRAAYLKAATDLLVDDLTWMAAQWQPGGTAREAVMKSTDAGLTAIITGMGSLSYGELAGERMKLGLILHDPEEEHDCFSDNTHESHYYDALGIRNVFLGRYRRVDGSVVSGPGIGSLVDSATAEAALKAIDVTMHSMRIMVSRAERIEAYDQMLGEGNDAGNAAVQAAIDGLIAQTREFQRIAAELKLAQIGFEGSDSLDAPDKVQ